MPPSAAGPGSDALVRLVGARPGAPPASSAPPATHGATHGTAPGTRAGTATGTTPGVPPGATPGSAPGSTTDALWTPGRLVAGRVLASAPDGRVVLELAGHRVDARAAVPLAEGSTPTFRVESRGGEWILRVVEPEAALEPRLAAALRGALGARRPVGELLTELAARLRAALAAPAGTGAGAAAAGSEPARALLEALGGFAFRPGAPGASGTSGTSGAELAGLVERLGLLLEALLAGRRRGGAEALRQGLRRDLKGRLLEAFGRLGEGEAKRAVARALAGLEAEQLLHLARREAGEPLQLAFPVPDGAPPGWATARLRVAQREAGEGEGRGGRASARRVSFGVTLRHTGPVRADLALREDGLTVQVSVTDEALAARIRGDLEQLAEAVGRGERTVEIGVRVAPTEEVDLEACAGDVDFLDRARLMDATG